jgi:hypothetical protein
MASRPNLNARIEIIKLENAAKARSDIMQAVRHLITSIMVFGIFYIIMTSLVVISKGEAGALEQFSKVVSALSLDRITAYIFGTGSVVWGMVERKGRKNAIKRVGALSRKIEQGDAYKASSELTETGDTPGG